MESFFRFCKQALWIKVFHLGIQLRVHVKDSIGGGGKKNLKYVKETCFESYYMFHCFFKKKKIFPCRKGSRALTINYTELYSTITNGFKSLTYVTKHKQLQSRWDKVSWTPFQKYFHFVLYNPLIQDFNCPEDLHTWLLDLLFTFI